MINIKDRTRARILNIIKAEKRALTEKELFRKCKGKSNPIRQNDFRAVLTELVRNGEVMQTKNGIRAVPADTFAATVTRLNKTFGFVRDNSLPREDQTEIFVPGKFMMGALPGDAVLCRYIESRGELPEAQIIAVTAENDAVFTGKVVIDGAVYV
ncbi:MAG: hypothetical protein IJ251_05080 [Oscillospiraceae bacterium]|nr:hypothetical protein [Oscillospiraceae bacterium]